MVEISTGAHSYRAERKGDAVSFYGQSIRGKKLVWKQIGTAKWDDRHGLYAISAMGIVQGALDQLQDELRKEGTNMASHVGLEVPSVEEVVKELKAIKREMIHGDVDEGGLEIRLQVLSNGNWTVHYGDPGFDTDHHGFWGASSLGGGETVEELEQIAKDLISDVEESAAQSDEGDDDEDEGEDFEGHGDITTRYVDGEDVPSINVKPPPLHGRLPAELRDAPQELLDSTFEQRAQEWWENDAPNLAERILGPAFRASGYQGTVRQDGRSGGHLIVTELPDVEAWNERQQKAWHRFEKAIKKSMKDAEKDWHKMIKDAL